MDKLIKAALVFIIAFVLTGCNEYECFENKPIDESQLINHHAYHLIDMLSPDDNIVFHNESGSIVYYSTVEEMTDEAKQYIVLEYNERNIPNKDGFEHNYHFTVKGN